VRIGEFCDEKPALPVSMQAQEAASSRLLDALEKKHRESQERTADAISYADLMKEVRSDV